MRDGLGVGCAACGWEEASRADAPEWAYLACPLGVRTVDVQRPGRPRMSITAYEDRPGAIYTRSGSIRSRSA